MKQYSPLIIWISVILLITYLISHVYYDYNRWSMMDMQVLMWVRFLVFWLIKLVDLNGFVSMFRQYDPLARLVSWYGYIFPLIEIWLWVIYLWDTYMQYWLATNIVAAIITGITSIWIVWVLMAKQSTVRCACMWSKATTPLWRPSLIEQWGMCLMAVWMLRMMC